MDNLKGYLTQLKKHHFWVLLGVVLIVAQASYHKARGALEKTFQDNRSRIDGALAQLRGVRNNSQQANETYTQRIEKEQEKMLDQSFGIWEVSWQKQLPKLTWPQQPAALADIAKYPPGTDIPEVSITLYQSNVEQQAWNPLFESLRLRRAAKGSDSAPRGPALGGLGASEKPVELKGIVSWDESALEELRNRIRFKRTPSTTRVRVAQEDLWVYTALLEAVKAMNKDVADDDVLAATVKRIDRIEIAQWAIKYAQDHPGAELGLRETDESGTAMLGQADGRITPPKAEQDLSDEAILDNRYIDENNRPVSAKALLNKSLDPSQPRPPFAEFRQMFVVMRLVMDQRRIPDLLAACANSSLPIEARQVMVHLADPTDSKAAQLDAAFAGLAKSDRGPYDGLVEVRGIVYLYNPPDKDKLGKGAAQNPARRSLGIPDKSVAPGAAPPPVDSFSY